MVILGTHFEKAIEKGKRDGPVFNIFIFYITVI